MLENTSACCVGLVFLLSFYSRTQNFLEDTGKSLKHLCAEVLKDFMLFFVSDVMPDQYGTFLCVKKYVQ